MSDTIRLAVIFGGRSCEHDVSVITAQQCMAAADTAQYNLLPVYIARDGAWYAGDRLRDMDFLRAFKPEAVTRVYPDVTSGSGALMAIERKKGLLGGDRLTAFARMDAALLALHGTHGEDGAVQGLLELMNVPYTSAGLVGSAVGMDKIVMRELLRGHGLPVVDALWLDRAQWERDADAQLKRAMQALPFPMFVKPANLGSSIGISRATDAQTLREAIEVALSYDRRALIERGIERPVEVNCAVLGRGADARASACEMPVSWEEFLTFDEKYLRGGAKGAPAKGTAPSGGMSSLSRQIPAPIGDEMTARVRELALAAFAALDCKGVARVDFMIDGEDLYLGEINTIPGSLAYYLWEPEGLTFAQLIDELVRIAYAAHAEKNRSVFAYDSTILSAAPAGRKGAKAPRA